jgi:hypothetical protein
VRVSKSVVVIRQKTKITKQQNNKTTRHKTTNTKQQNKTTKHKTKKQKKQKKTKKTTKHKKQNKKTKKNKTKKKKHETVHLVENRLYSVLIFTKKYSSLKFSGICLLVNTTISSIVKKNLK